MHDDVGFGIMTAGCFTESMTKGRYKEFMVQIQSGGVETWYRIFTQIELELPWTLRRTFRVHTPRDLLGVPCRMIHWRSEERVWIAPILMSPQMASKLAEGRMLPCLQQSSVHLRPLLGFVHMEGTCSDIPTSRMATSPAPCSPSFAATGSRP